MNTDGLSHRDAGEIGRLSCLIRDPLAGVRVGRVLNPPVPEGGPQGGTMPNQCRPVFRVGDSHRQADSASTI